MVRRIAVIEIDIYSLENGSPIDSDVIESLKLLKILRVGDTKGSAIARIRMMHGKTLSDISRDRECLDHEVLSQEGNEYTCILRKNAEALLSKIFSGRTDMRDS